MSAWKSAVVRAVIAAIGSPNSARARVDLVVDVGDVADIGDARIEPAQQPRQHVEDHHRARVADMRQVVDRRAAHIHAHVLGIERLEPLLPAGQAVVQDQVVHGRSVRPRRALVGKRTPQRVNHRAAARLTRLPRRSISHCRNFARHSQAAARWPETRCASAWPDRAATGRDRRRIGAGFAGGVRPRPGGHAGRHRCRQRHHRRAERRAVGLPAAAAAARADPDPLHGAGADGPAGHLHRPRPRRADPRHVRPVLGLGVGRRPGRRHDRRAADRVLRRRRRGRAVRRAALRHAAARRRRRCWRWC